MTAAPLTPAAQNPLQSLPPALLPQLTPAAAKVYLVLLTHQDRTAKLPLTRAPIETIASAARLSHRACWRAIRQLSALTLIARLPRAFHAPNTYLFLTPPPAQTSPTTLTPASQFTPPPAPTGRIPVPKSPSPSPVPAPENPTVPPVAQLLTSNEDAVLRSLMAMLSPAETTAILAQARSVLDATAYLDAPTLHQNPPPRRMPP
jgi:hypothetical protein